MEVCITVCPLKLDNALGGGGMWHCTNKAFNQFARRIVPGQALCQKQKKPSGPKHIIASHLTRKTEMQIAKW